MIKKCDRYIETTSDAVMRVSSDVVGNWIFLLKDLK